MYYGETNAAIRITDFEEVPELGQIILNFEIEQRLLVDYQIALGDQVGGDIGIGIIPRIEQLEEKTDGLVDGASPLSFYILAKEG